MQILVYFFSGERACCRRTINKNVMLSGKGTKIIEMFFVLHGGSIFFAKVVKKVFFTKYIFVFLCLKMFYNMLREINDKRVGGMKKKLYLCRLLNVKKVE